MLPWPWDWLGTVTQEVGVHSVILLVCCSSFSYVNFLFYAYFKSISYRFLITKDVKFKIHNVKSIADFCAFLYHCDIQI